MVPGQSGEILSAPPSRNRVLKLLRVYSPVDENPGFSSTGEIFFRDDGSIEKRYTKKEHLLSKEPLNESSGSN